MTYDRYPTTTYYKWITSPYASAAASIMASLMVGCGCTVLMISCPVVSSLRATTTSAIISVTLAPIMCEIGRSTRLNSSHVKTSYAVFCLKKRSIVRACVACTCLFSRSRSCRALRSFPTRRSSDLHFAVCIGGGLHNGFTHGGVWMHGFNDFVPGSFQLTCHHHLGDHLRYIGANHV